jgi:SAM-dependent methyltransferase
MNLLGRVILHLKEKGIYPTFIVILYRIADYYFDFKYHTDTANSIPLVDLEIASDNKDRGYSYQPTMAIPFYRLMDKVPLPADPVLVDFGCGKGRVLMLAAIKGIRKSAGIEFSGELCNVARKNIAILQDHIDHRIDVTIIESDVTRYEIEDNQNVFFLANPFDDVILNSVANNILKSLDKNQRTIIIIYYNPIHSDILEKYFTLEKKIHIAAEKYFLYSNN